MTKSGKTLVLIALIGGIGLGGNHLIRAEEGPDFEALHAGLRVSDYLRDEIEAQGGAVIPVLVPHEMTIDQETADAFAFGLKLDRDGYSAVLTDETWDYAINGTRRARYRPSNRSGGETTRALDYSGFETIRSAIETSEEDSGPAWDYLNPYEPFGDGHGGSITFGFRGAHYLLELYCLTENPDRPAKEGCPEPDMIEDFAVFMMTE